MSLKQITSEKVKMKQVKEKLPPFIVDDVASRKIQKAFKKHKDILKRCYSIVENPENYKKENIKKCMLAFLKRSYENLDEDDFLYHVFISNEYAGIFNSKLLFKLDDKSSDIEKKILKKAVFDTYKSFINKLTKKQIITILQTDMLHLLE